MSGSDAADPLPTAVFKVYRDGHAEYRAFCQLPNGTGDWAFVHTRGGILEKTWRKDVWVRSQIEKYRKAAECVFPGDTIDTALKEVLDALVEATQTYNPSGTRIITGKNGFPVFAGTTAARRRPDRRRLRELHVWI